MPSTLTTLPALVRDMMGQWRQLPWSAQHFAEARAALLVIVVLGAVALLVLIVRAAVGRNAGRSHVGLPAVLPVMRRSRLSAGRHGPFLVFVAGLPFFVLALADPRTSFARRDQAAPGRRIAILLDGSASMLMPFKGVALNPRKLSWNATFYAEVAAAELFIRLRMNGRYSDLIALLQFGNEAYVITPFTTDYENVLLSMRLAGDPKEWNRFEDSGTTIVHAIEEGVELFKTYDFLDAAGNLMVIFSDGRDSQAQLGGRTLDDVMAGAREHKIPVYMIRTAFEQKLGDIPDDRLWQPAIERTGGRFYPGADETSVLQAIEDIDRLSPGRIERREYSVDTPTFPGYAFAALTLWLTAALLKLAFPVFRTFP